MVRSLAFKPDGKFLASGSEDRTVRIWDLATGIPRILRGHRNIVISVAFSTDGKMLASASADFDVRLWNIDSISTAPSSAQALADWLTSLTTMTERTE
jgi:WD40 repeat protein